MNFSTIATLVSHIRVDLTAWPADLQVVGNVVVPVGSRVSHGLQWTFPSWPSQEASTTLFKQMFGIRKRKVVVEEEEEPPLLHFDICGATYVLKMF